jgi:hypothetical protein
MKVDGSTAEVSQKIDREGAGLRFGFSQNGRTGGFACGLGLHRCKTLNALRYKARWRYGCPEAKVIMEIPV